MIERDTCSSPELQGQLEKHTRVIEGINVQLRAIMAEVQEASNILGQVQFAIQIQRILDAIQGVRTLTPEEKSIFDLCDGIIFNRGKQE